MRVAIINVTGGGMSGGYRTYLRNVLPRLAVHPNVEAILCATPPTVGAESWFPPLSKVLFIPCTPFRFLHHRPGRALAQAVARFAPDVIFIPVERYLCFDGIPLVVMLQNMGPLLPVPGNPLSERLRYVAQRHETRVAIQRADHVIVPTNFVHKFLTDTWHISKEKVTAIHYGVSLPSPRGRGEGEGGAFVPQKPAAVSEKWAGKFLFTAGSIEPYRGLEDVLGAMQNLRDEATIAGLAIAGEARGNMVSYQKRLQKWIEYKGLSKKVCWVGSLQAGEMAWYYRNCRIFVMTSRIESFGIIGLEALARGCVCVVADNPPLPEIFGDAARYYASTDVKALANAIKETLALDQAARRRESERTRARAALFSWDQNVEQLVDVLQGARTAARMSGL